MLICLNFLSLALGRPTFHSAAAEGHTQNDSVRGANPQVQFHVITNTGKNSKSVHNINYFWFNSTDFHNSQITSANQIFFFFSILCFHSKNENNSHSEVVASKLEVIVKADVILQGWAEC